MRLKLTLEYDGTRFRGWAAQPSLRTVEGVMRDALGWVYEYWDRLAVAGRRSRALTWTAGRRWSERLRR